MQRESYKLYSIIGLILTLVLTAGLTAAIWGETDRMNKRSAEVDKLRIRNGRELYTVQCTSCHGTRGEGGVGPALNSRDLLTKASDTVLFATIRAGRPGTNMPAWGQENGGPLTDEDISEIVSFLRAWQPTAPVVVKNKFEPNAARGAAVFATTCFVCHGENGHGGKAPALNDPLRLAKLDDEWYRQTIRMGRPAKGMPTWGTVLSPNQIEDLIAMIRAWRGGTKVDTDSTVADNLRSSLFSLSQGDVEDAIFYIDRAKPMVFGAAAPEFEKIRQDLADKKLNDALAGLSKLHKEWPLGDAVQGEKIFGDACASCHGANGEGGVGRRLKPSKFTASQTNAELLQFLFVGREGTAMRGFKGRLTEKQLADAIAFLRTWQNAAEK